MHDAQCIAGMAFTNGLLGIVHSMAHKTGAAFTDHGAHIIHGAANAMYLPKVIQFNAQDPQAKRRYQQIAEEMRIGSTVESLVQFLRGMNKQLQIPQSIKDYAKTGLPGVGFVPEEVFLQRVGEIARNALGDACTGSNPRKPTEQEMERLLKCCFYDTSVTF